MAEETDSPEEKNFELQDLKDAEAPAAKGGGEGEGEKDAPRTLGEAGGFPDIGDLPRSAKDLEAVYDIPVKVSAVLGKTTMQVSQLLKLGRGAVIELDRKVGEAIDIYVNNRLVARGEVVVVEERLGVTMTEIIKTDSSN
jgi:flagellar motor switch protein FliN/FliY|tara:strand:+ start:896 stop:1315 length:420 start_codon:yes stop_codon:yes gene_type:complete